jgi:hypothetical protein
MVIRNVGGLLANCRKHLEDSTLKSQYCQNLKPKTLISQFECYSFFQVAGIVHRDADKEINHIPGEERVFLQPRDRPKPQCDHRNTVQPAGPER